MHVRYKCGGLVTESPTRRAGGPWQEKRPLEKGALRLFLRNEIHDQRLAKNRQQDFDERLVRRVDEVSVAIFSRFEIYDPAMREPFVQALRAGVGSHSMDSTASIFPFNAEKASVTFRPVRRWLRA